MAVEHDGGPAFPSLEVYEGYDPDREAYVVKSDVATGMKLRDYFAAQALGICTPRYVMANGHMLTEDIEAAAHNAYAIADAMLKVRG